MASPVSALDGHFTADHATAYGRDLKIAEVSDLHLMQISAWPDTFGSVEKSLAAKLGFSKRPKAGAAMQNGEVTLARVEPLKWWVLATAGGEVTLPEMSASEGCLLDLSHSRTWLAVSGEKASQLLNRFLPIDLRDAKFPAGTVATTSFHHTGVTVWRSDDGNYNVLLLRSFAVSLWQMLHETALQFKT